jgi:hypothetical protein
MSLMPYGSSSSDIAMQVALGALTQDKAEQSTKMQLSGLIAGATATKLSDATVAVTESFVRKANAISELSISDDIKSQLLAQAVANSNAFENVMVRIADNAANLIR